MTNATASTATFIIEEPQASAVGKRSFALRITTADGAPVAGVEVIIGLEGDGSFAQGFSSKEIKRTTGADGSASFAWHRRGIYGRNVRGILSIAAPTDGQSVEIIEVEEETSETNWISYRQRARKY
jgi:hypothetical protein